MTIDPIRLSVETSAAPERTWEWITEPDLVARWFADVSPVGAPGAVYRIDFGDGSLVDGRIVSVEPGRSFSHEWTWNDSEPGETTLVTWQVTALPDGGARVDLVHDGWLEANADEQIRDEHEEYWSGYLDDLAALLEEGDPLAAG